MTGENHLLIGRYRLEQRIGSGAMGVVWRAYDDQLHRTVAVKQVLLQPGLTPEEAEVARQRALREGRIAARLHHPNAVSVFDVVEEHGQPWLVMEYLPSRSLAAVVGEQGTMSPSEAAAVGSNAAAALAAAHDAGIVHRDVKPGNILLGDNGAVKITDFGLSRAVGDAAITKSGEFAGTPAYLAPEVAQGFEPAPSSDVFSLGATIYAAIEGEPPFGSQENSLALLRIVAAGEVRAPRGSGPLTDVLMRLLNPDPAKRPTMAEAADMLTEVAATQVSTVLSVAVSSNGQTVFLPDVQHDPRIRPTTGWPPAPPGGIRPVSPGGGVRPAESGGRNQILLFSTIPALVAIVVAVIVALGTRDSQIAGRPDGNGRSSAENRNPGLPPGQQVPTETSASSTSQPQLSSSAAPPTKPGEQHSPQSPTAGQPNTTQTADPQGGRPVPGPSNQWEQLVQNHVNSVGRGDFGAAYRLLSTDLQQRYGSAQGYRDSAWPGVSAVAMTDPMTTSGYSVTTHLRITRGGTSTNETWVYQTVADLDQGSKLVITSHSRSA